ncbi:HtaA domain-containing protein [Natronoglycomyces albus]|uniref:HtaA domain-containing protein n=1 Tax=Natronoglycomyces albus TaxID=2811108 RepID=A0A895XMC3_9ACTN|nr:HtaA domain-containing protein [Natronoglycomyces albus]QSB04145.1 HtaA domain-containing protein [Natronoglycomyces albus]
MSPSTQPRRSRKRRAALAVAAMFAAQGALFLAPQTVSADESQSFPIVDGFLDWGFKESFRNYVSGPIAGGDITVSDGAERNGDGSFRFTDATGEYSRTSHNVSVETEGTVHFHGHSGDLDVTFENIRVQTDHAANSGKVIIDVTSGSNSYPDTHFADLDLEGLSWDRGDLTIMSDIPSVLTEAGSDSMVALINGNESRFYQAGETLDPLTIAIEADASGGGSGGSGGGGGGGGDTGDKGEEDDEKKKRHEDEPDGPLTIEDGRLDWGFKDSFRNYITGPIANGTITVAGGAENNSSSFGFVDAHGTFDPDTGELDARFSGSVNFYGHSGSLDLTFEDLRIAGEASNLKLYTNGAPIADLKVDALALKGDQLVLADVPATLTEQGADLMAGDVNGNEVRFYEPGDALDLVYVALAFEEGVDLGSGTGRLPVTGTTLTWALAGGAALLVVGTAALVMTRRRVTMPA